MIKIKWYIFSKQASCVWSTPKSPDSCASLKPSDTSPFHIHHPGNPPQGSSKKTSNTAPDDWGAGSEGWSPPASVNTKGHNCFFCKARQADPQRDGTGLEPQTLPLTAPKLSRKMREGQRDSGPKGEFWRLTQCRFSDPWTSHVYH